MSRIIDTPIEITINFKKHNNVELKIYADKKIKHCEYLINNYICKEDLYVELLLSDIPYSDYLNFSIIKDGYGKEFTIYNHGDPIVDLDWLCKNKYNIGEITNDFLSSISYNDLTVTKFISCLIIILIESDLNIPGIIVDMTSKIEDNYLDKFLTLSNISTSVKKSSFSSSSSAKTLSIKPSTSVLKIKSSEDLKTIDRSNNSSKESLRSVIKPIYPLHSTSKESIVFSEPGIYPSLSFRSKYESRYPSNSSDLPKRSIVEDSVIPKWVSKFSEYCKEDCIDVEKNKDRLKKLISESEILKNKQNKVKELHKNSGNYKCIAKLTDYI